MILVGWILLGIEVLISVLCALIFWHFWSHSAMPRATAIRATVIYGLGCLLCLLFTFFLPI